MWPWYRITIGYVQAYASTQPKAGLSASVLRWIFAGGWSLSPSELGAIPADVARDILVTGPDGPLAVPEFTRFWAATLQAHTREPNARWLWELTEAATGCREGEPCRLPPLRPSPLLLPALDVFYAYALALRDAWARECPAPGLCPALVRLAPDAFAASLRSLNFTYGPDIRSPPSLAGRKVAMGSPVSTAAVYQLQLVSTWPTSQLALRMKTGLRNEKT